MAHSEALPASGALPGAPTPPPAAPPPAVPVAFEPLKGSQLVLGTIALSLATFMNVLDTSIANVSIPAIAGDMGVSPAQGTWVITSFAVANAISVPLTGWLAARFGQVRLFVASVFLFGLVTIVFGFSKILIVSMACLFIAGAADMFSVYVRQSLIQLNTPDDKRGRVSSISGLAISASNELGEMQSGVAAGLLGAVGAVVFGGMGAIVVTLVWAWYFPELRRASSFEPQELKREVTT